MEVKNEKRRRSSGFVDRYGGTRRLLRSARRPNPIGSQHASRRSFVSFPILLSWAAAGCLPTSHPLLMRPAPHSEMFPIFEEATDGGDKRRTTRRASTCSAPTYFVEFWVW
jgi:hypothetical protein